MHDKRHVRLTACALCACLVISGAVRAYAAPAGEDAGSAYLSAERARAEAEDAFRDVTDEMERILEEQDRIQEEIDALDAGIVAIMIEIGQTDEDIAAMEDELAAAREAYGEAKATEEEQRSSMSQRIVYMYENGDESFFDALVSGTGFAGVLNRVGMARDVYETDRGMLEAYEEATEAVREAKAVVEEKEEALEDLKAELESQKAELEEEKAAREEEYDGYDEEYAEAERLAAEYRGTIREMSEEIAEALGISTTVILSEGTSLEKGTAVVEYASLFIGNKYVWGGESLTDGCDCSGFVKSVYAHFGVSLPHYSGSLRNVGYEVSESEIQPGDIVCYEGHVGIYAGNGKIINASNPKPYPQGGIKYSSVHTKKIITIRRIFA